MISQFWFLHTISILQMFNRSIQELVSRMVLQRFANASESNKLFLHHVIVQKRSIRFIHYSYSYLSLLGLGGFSDVETNRCHQYQECLVFKGLRSSPGMMHRWIRMDTSEKLPFMTCDALRCDYDKILHAVMTCGSCGGPCATVLAG